MAEIFFLAVIFRLRYDGDMNVLYWIARMAAAFCSLLLWLVWADELSKCVPEVSVDHAITRLWWGRGTETAELKEGEWLTPPEHGYAEKGYDIRYSFRLSEGAVLEMLYYCLQIKVTEADLCAAEAAGGVPADGAHTITIGFGRDVRCLLDGKALPARCLRNKPGKAVCLHNAGTGQIALADLLVEFPQWRNLRR